MAAPRWFIARNREKVGPFSGADIKQLASFGLLQPNEFLWAEGSTKWVEAASVPGLFPQPGQKRYWLSLGGQTRGPYALDQIRAGLTARQFDLDTQACAEGAAQWLALGKLSELQGFVPAEVTPSRAQLFTHSLDLEEAALHLAGKGGDTAARLISTLLDMKRAYAHNASLVESFDKTIKLLQARREEQAAAKPPAGG
jgi:hypothetical protein